MFSHLCLVGGWFLISINFLRQGVTGYKGQKVENDSKRSKELRAAPAPDANAELATSMQVYSVTCFSSYCYL